MATIFSVQKKAPSKAVQQVNVLRREIASSGAAHIIEHALFVQKDPKGPEYSSILTALSRRTDERVIFVGPGVYFEADTIVVPPNVSIVGSEPGNAHVTLLSSAENLNKPVIRGAAGAALIDICVHGVGTLVDSEIVPTVDADGVTAALANSNNVCVQFDGDGTLPPFELQSVEFGSGHTLIKVDDSEGSCAIDIDSLQQTNVLTSTSFNTLIDVSRNAGNDTDVSIRNTQFSGTFERGIVISDASGSLTEAAQSGQTFIENVTFVRDGVAGAGSVGISVQWSSSIALSNVSMSKFYVGVSVETTATLYATVMCYENVSKDLVIINSSSTGFVSGPIGTFTNPSAVKVNPSSEFGGLSTESGAGFSTLGTTESSLKLVVNSSDVCVLSSTGVPLTVSTTSTEEPSNVEQFMTSSTSNAQNGLYSAKFSGQIETAGVTVTSDRRLKADIVEVPTEASATVLRGLRAHQFVYKDRPSGTRVGLMAQDVEARDSRCVFKNSEGYLGVDQSATIAHLVNVVNNLEEKVETLQRLLL
jgi:hypothetical protein